MESDTLMRRASQCLGLTACAVATAAMTAVVLAWPVLVVIAATFATLAISGVIARGILSRAIFDDRIERRAPLGLLTEELLNRTEGNGFQPLPYESEVPEVQELLRAMNALLDRADTMRIGVDEMLDQMHQGVMSFEKDMIILKNYSRYLHKIFGDESPVGKGASEYLFAKTDLPQESVRQMQFHLKGLFGMNKLQWIVSSMNFVKDATVILAKKKTDVRFHFFPSYDEKGNIIRISVVVDDVTEFNQAKKQADHRQKEMEKIFSLLQVSDTLFQTFMDETAQLFDKLKTEAKLLKQCDQTSYGASVGRMFRYVHTLKGNSKLFKLNSIQDVAHDVESYLSDLRDGKVPFDQAAIEVLMSKLMEINQEIYSYTSLRREILGHGERAASLTLNYRIQWIKTLLAQFSAALRDPRLDVREIDRVQWELHRVLSSFDKTSLVEYINRYDGLIQDIARKSGKKIGPIVRRLDYRYFDNHTMGRINDILGHLIRNCVDHGIEAAEERDNLAKPMEGTLRIETFGKDNMIHVVIADDGAGLDRARILKRAVEKGLVSAESAPTLADVAVYDFIFQPGFSTARAVTEVSGRGVGMDAVRAIVEEMEGTILIDTTPGHGTRFTVAFPEKTEGFMTPYTIFDIRQTVHASFREFGMFFNLARVSTHFEAPKDGQNTFVMGDRLAITEILKNICLELFDTVAPGAVVNCSLETNRGLRRLDSFEFFRFVFRCEAGGRSVVRPINPDSLGLKKAHELLRKHNGSIKVAGADILELNIPSNMPVSFSDYEFRIALFVDDPGSVTTYVTEYFDQVMGGWRHSIFPGFDLMQLNGDRPQDATIVVLQENKVEEYEKARDPELRPHDTVILVAASAEGIDKMDAVSILPDHVMFIPGPVSRQNLANVLEAIILQRFAREIMDPEGRATRERLALAG